MVVESLAESFGVSLPAQLRIDACSQTLLVCKGHCCGICSIEAPRQNVVHLETACKRDSHHKQHVPRTVHAPSAGAVVVLPLGFCTGNAHSKPYVVAVGWVHRHEVASSYRQQWVASCRFHMKQYLREDAKNIGFKYVFKFCKFLRSMKKRVLHNIRF